MIVLAVYMYAALKRIIYNLLSFYVHETGKCWLASVSFGRHGLTQYHEYSNVTPRNSMFVSCRCRSLLPLTHVDPLGVLHPSLASSSRFAAAAHAFLMTTMIWHCTSTLVAISMERM